LYLAFHADVAALLVLRRPCAVSSGELALAEVFGAPSVSPVAAMYAATESAPAETGVEIAADALEFASLLPPQACKREVAAISATKVGLVFSLFIMALDLCV
jgi:hypothetical protein